MKMLYGAVMKFDDLSIGDHFTFAVNPSEDYKFGYVKKDNKIALRTLTPYSNDVGIEHSFIHRKHYELVIVDTILLSLDNICKNIRDGR